MSLSQAFSVFWFKLRLVSLFYSSISKYANIFSRFDFIVIGWASDVHSTLPITMRLRHSRKKKWSELAKYQSCSVQTTRNTKIYADIKKKIQIKWPIFNRRNNRINYHFQSNWNRPENTHIRRAPTMHNQRGRSTLLQSTNNNNKNHSSSSNSMSSNFGIFFFVRLE